MTMHAYEAEMTPEQLGAMSEDEWRALRVAAHTQDATTEECAAAVELLRILIETREERGT